MIGGVKKKDEMKRAKEWIDFLGRGDRHEHKPSKVWGGGCQRVAVARALIKKPAVSLADEPSGSLDSQNKRELHSLFFKLRDEMNQTIVIVTHDESLSADCDRVLHMKDGIIVEDELRKNITI